MAALLGPPPDDLAADEDAFAGAVTTMVCPPTVTTDCVAAKVDEGEESSEDCDEGEPVAVACFRSVFPSSV